tara:strand:+ start:2018 stop:2443 length:426 start_codon:yes stop_codon:yes gene_type:complete
MNFCNFDLSKLPLIKVTLNGEITSKKMDVFFKKWLEIYILKTDHSIIFDITNAYSPNVKCAIKLAKFIKKIKEKPPFLQRCIVIINENGILRNLFKMVFTITRPAAPMFVYWKKTNEQYINNDTIMDVFHTNILKFQYIRP